jgi:hypothetical protein
MSWNPIPGILTSSGIADAGVVFDPTSPLEDGATLGIHGHGLYRSTDGARSFFRISGGPTSIDHGRMASDGTYYATDKTNRKFWKCVSDTWTDLTGNLHRGAIPETAWFLVRLGIQHANLIGKFPLGNTD